MSKEISSTAMASPNRFIRLLTSRMGAGIGGLVLLEQVVLDLVRQMTRLALFAEDFALVLGLAIMTAKAVRRAFFPQDTVLWMIGIERLAVHRDMAAWQHDGIALDRRLVHHARMARGAALSLSALPERVHMFPVAHDQSD